MALIFALNFALLIGLVAGLLRWQKKHGRLSADKFALLMTGYFTFSFVTTLLPYLVNYTRVTVVVDAVFLLVLWCVGYPLFRWIYGQFVSSK
jgi:hypothetical protein